MSWILVAKKDFQDAIRSKMIWGLSALFILFSGGLTSYLYLTAGAIEGTGGSSVVSILLPMLSASSTFVPLVGFAVAYKSIVGERESGSLKLLLALPHTRFDVMVGKFVGRSLVVVIAIVVGYIAGIAPIFVLPLTISYYEFFTLILMTVLLGVVSVAIATAFSTAMRSARRALYGVIGIFVLIEWLWDRIPLYAAYVLNGFQSPNGISLPNWAEFLYNLNPKIAYTHSIAYLSPSPTGGIAAVNNSLPFYLKSWFGFVILAFWIIIPLSLAYYRFYTLDLD